MPSTILEGPKIYNLFPRLAGKMNLWTRHFERIKDLGFDWVFINPIHYPGLSGSLYAPLDYYSINPLFVDADLPIEPMGQLKNMIDEAHRLGLKLMMDLVINHTAKEHPFTKQHPAWYKKNELGEIKSPGAWDNGQWIEWNDLAEIDNLDSFERASIWDYWKNLILFYMKMGFDGFRADAAYQVPGDLWNALISTTRKKNKNIQFFAESLGCSPEQTLVLAQSGFDYIFNSSKWWNFTDSWLLEQLDQTRNITPSISFPESHDTPRISIEADNNLAVIKQRTLFTALFSTGWMIPMGFEFGFMKRMDVCRTMPEDWEEINYDLTSFIRNIHLIRKNISLFSRESQAEILHHPNEENILILKRSLPDSDQKALLILNKDRLLKQNMVLNSIQELFGIGSKKGFFQELSVEKPAQDLSLGYFERVLEPSETIVLYFSGPK